MKKFLLCIIFILPFISFAQMPCNETQLTLSSQADVDNFPQTMNGCTVLCALTIEGSDITNLDGLHVLQSVGFLQLSFNSVLTDISGLSNLTTIGGTTCYRQGLTIEWNNSLSSLDGLTSLTQVDGPVTISGNTMLSDVKGLSQLTSIGTLDISRNASLLDVNDLSALTRIEGGLIVSGNPGLYDVNGLSNVTTIGGPLVIDLNDALATLGLSDLTHIEQFVSITYNYDLASLTGLSNLEHIGQLTGTGQSLEIMFNDDLESLDGLQGLDTVPGILTVEGNGSLENIDALSNVVTLDAPIGGSYVAGIRIANNTSLTDISGIANVATIGRGRLAFFEIENNDALTAINPLSLNAIAGSIGSRLLIKGNDRLRHVDGLSELTSITSGQSSYVEISNNASLDDLHGLSNLRNLSSAQAGTLTITNNTELGSFCGLYTLFHSNGINCGFPECYSTEGVTIEGNERNPSPEQIEEEGPCDAVVTQPTNIAFSQVTSEGMRVKFNRPTGFASGFIALVKSHGPPAPDDVPEDGQSYHVGQVIGSSSIVVHVGTDTTFVVSGLEPSTPYYFDVFSYKVTAEGNDYRTESPLEGFQATSAPVAVASTLAFTEVSDESLTVMLDEQEPGSYIALMKAFGYPAPNDVPVNGTEYHVGDVVGSSTIVVNNGNGSAFTVNGLEPGVTYYFNVFRYEPSTFVYETTTTRGSQKTAQSGENLRPYPNPFDVATSIPFVVSREQTVHVTIYNSIGQVVTVLANGSFDAGRHEASWDGFDAFGRRMNSGVYIYSVKSEGGVVTGRISLR